MIKLVLCFCDLLSDSFLESELIDAGIFWVGFRYRTKLNCGIKRQEYQLQNPAIMIAETNSRKICFEILLLKNMGSGLYGAQTEDLRRKCSSTIKIDPRLLLKDFNNKVVWMNVQNSIEYTLLGNCMNFCGMFTDYTVNLSEATQREHFKKLNCVPKSFCFLLKAYVCKLIMIDLKTLTLI